jgi:hypothetical protein
VVHRSSGTVIIYFNPQILRIHIENGNIENCMKKIKKLATEDTEDTEFFSLCSLCSLWLKKREE